jgi:hypothetical protein
MGGIRNQTRLTLVVALLAVFFLQSVLSCRLKSPTFDEPAHIAAGISYLSTRVFHANLQHPPLIKELSAVFAMAAGARWPDTPEARALIANPPGRIPTASCSGRGCR